MTAEEEIIDEEEACEDDSVEEFGAEVGLSESTFAEHVDGGVPNTRPSREISVKSAAV